MGVPPPGVGGHHPMAGTSSGSEGREELLGQAVTLAIRTLKDALPYQHAMNDALVKMHLTALPFAKDEGLVKELVDHDIKTMQPMLMRIKGIIEKAGDKEIALIGKFDRAACLYHLRLDLKVEKGRRELTFPFTTVLDISRKVGQFDMTSDEVHELWMKPRLHGYAACVGVKLEVSGIGPDGKVVVKLAD
jgi:hypothetical protein